MPPHVNCLAQAADDVHNEDEEILDIEASVEWLGALTAPRMSLTLPR